MIIFNEKISNILDPSDPKATTGMDLIKCNFQCVFGHLSAQFTVHPMLRRIDVCVCVCGLGQGGVALSLGRFLCLFNCRRCVTLYAYL